MEMLVIAIVVILAFLAALVPLFRRRAGFGDEREFENTPPAPAAAEPAATPQGPADAAQDATENAAADRNGDEVELEVQRYRAALRAGTICGRCGQANPVESLFCFECGASLPRADAQEFE